MVWLELLQCLITHRNHVNMANMDRLNTILFWFISAMLIGIMGLNLVIPLSVAFTVAGGHKISKNQNLLASVFQTFFS